MTASSSAFDPGYSLGKTLNFRPTGAYSGKYKLPEDLLKNYTTALNKTATGADPVPSQTFPTDSIPDTIPATDEIAKNWAQMYPMWKQSLFDMAQAQSELNRQSYADAYPWLSAAAREAKTLDFGLTQKMLGYKETLPSAIQARAASMQAQKQAASSAFAEEQNAITNAALAGATMASTGSYRPWAG